MAAAVKKIIGKDRTLVGRPVFKTGGGRQTSLVGSIPTLFRQLERRAGFNELCRAGEFA